MCFSITLGDKPPSLPKGGLTFGDETQEMISSRELKFINCVNERKWMSENKSIMDYAVSHVNQKEIGCEVIESINHVRMSKRMMLPCEIFGSKGDKVTKEAREVNATSSIMWNVKFDIVPLPHKRLVETWSDFVEWIKVQQIRKIVDFGNDVKTKYEMTDDLKYANSNVDN